LLPANRQAHEAYLRGRYCWNRRTEEGIKKGIEYFQQAIELDPEYALAYAGLADCYTILAVYGLLAPREAKVEAERAACKALEINDDLAEGHNSLGAVRFRFDWDWEQTEAALQRARTLNPSYADAHLSYALYLQALGRLDESIAETRRACDLDPLSLLMETALGRALYFARQYDAAIVQCRKALELDGGYLPARFNLGRALVEKGQYGEAIAELKRAAEAGEVLYLAALGNAYARAGQGKRARLVLARIEKRAAQSYVSAYDLAKMHMGLGQKQQAMEYLERAHTDRSTRLVTLRVDPLFEALHSEARFQGLLRRMRLEGAPPG
jgi:tetratricopeptide (TPR) repeat protein